MGQVISIHAPRVGCDVVEQPGADLDALISIHAPRVGCDDFWGGAGSWRNNFNPRTPCGVRLSLPTSSAIWEIFQSTHPVWGATTLSLYHLIWTSNFNPRTPCGVRRRVFGRIYRRQKISIHAPRVGCDADGSVSPFSQLHFNPRTPCGVRLGLTPRLERIRYFNPRTPCGVRHG